MLKRFFAAFLGSLTAIWVTIGLLFVISIVATIAIVAGVAASGDSGVLTEGSILKIDLSGSISDRTSVPSVSDVLMERAENGQSFETIVAAIRHAANDKKIEGIYLECNGASMGYALREELVEALKEFKKSGKWIQSYSDGYTQGDYYVASVADTISLNPVGSVDIRGIAAQIPYFKNALDKLGIKMQVVKVGTFKSAVEPYLLDGPSEANVLQTHVYIDSIWNNLAGQIASARKVSKQTVNDWADSIIYTAPAKWLKANKVVNVLEYRRVFEDRLRHLTDTDEDDDLPVVSPADYVKLAKNLKYDMVSGFSSHGKHIAILYATGDIVDSGQGGIVGDEMVPEIISLAQDDDVAGVVLRVNSGGGSAFASEQIWEALEFLKSKGKPLYVSMADYAASGGYYISCGADRIFADPNTITGSIGIFGMLPDLSGLLTDKIGVNFVTIQTNPNADFGNITKGMTPQQHAALQHSVDDGYALFTGRVAKGRNMPIDSVLAIAEGRVWDGRTALRIGLVDELGSMQKAIAAMAKKTKLKVSDVVSYPRVSLTPLEQMLLGGVGDGAPAMRAGVTDMAPLVFEGMTTDEARDCLSLLRSLRSSSPVQARMTPVYLR